MNKLLNTSVLRFSYDIMHTLELSAILNVMQPPVARETFAFGGGSWRLVVEQKTLWSLLWSLAEQSPVIFPFRASRAYLVISKNSHQLSIKK